MKKAIIFDMDGVICHTNPFHSVAFQEFFAKRGLYPTEEEFAMHMYGKSNSYIMSHFLERKVEGNELLELEDEKESLFREIYQDKVNPINGFLEFFESLKENGLLTGVATSAPRANLELIIGQLGIVEKMESIMASEDVTKHKPDPEVYIQSAKNLGVAPEHCVVFEDSFSGVTAAKNAGMKVVGVLSSHIKEELPICEFYIEDYKKLDVMSLIKLIFSNNL
ncbi:Beta-phosphoglucomutase [Indibacter alkaliphilus LW1]|uniref:Beta-phosphoglucomutase n=1 Tax=Indibacter alkaliphilus (strain CCUG 57479 / KCTC 22604 / LW1) TaxID=1189612 RepID=S2EB83_INDAL|nr:HAD family phosphatase [Indibacter alkaliphilus]EOZ99573.1 Beta-phosphoglucomutase [Indibacter alkaliphilus LW1]